MRVDAIIVILAMLLPFITFKDYNLSAYLYWILTTLAYLLYISLKRWSDE